MQAIRPRRAAPLTAVLVSGCLLAGCTFSAEPQLLRPTRSAPAAAESASDAGSAGDFGGSAQLLGPFRRGGVPVPSDVLLAATSVCRTTPPSPATTEVGERPVVVADLRGSGRVLLVFADKAGAVACRVSVRDDGSMRAAFSRVKASGDAPLKADALTLGGLDYETAEVVAVGRVGDAAAHVRAGFDDDTYVTATIDNGWWAMWWPGGVQPAGITADDTHNVVIATVDPRQP